MSDRAIEIELSDRAAWIWMNRPEVHNAFNEDLIEELTAAYVTLAGNADIRVIVLSGRGKSFSAGADVEWMKRQGNASVEDNIADARKLASLFQTIAEFPKPTIARVQGAAIGGGLGLVAACDIAIGSNSASFATSEVRLGLIPATIAPYVIRAIGERQARCLFQSGERIDASTALTIGLLQATSNLDQLDETVRVKIDQLLLGAPRAQTSAKDLIRAIANKPIVPDLIEYTVQQLALCRTQSEATEGVSAFLDKRTPVWVLRK